MKKFMTMTSILALSSMALTSFANAEETTAQAQNNVQTEMPATAEKAVPVIGQQAVEFTRKAADQMMQGQGRGQNFHSFHHNGKHPYDMMRMMAYHHPHQFGGYKPQGFIDQNAVAKDAKAPLEAKDRSFVQLEGSISKQVNDTEYTFVDSTGQIKIEVPPSLWRGLSVGPQDKVRIDGILDKQWEQPEIKVKNITRLK
ncbi:NirD/YgiW/YdeI family stress tolerance protein [Actinobacillus pleuropneumoniae]|uniref:NirD/YgiW/YdeI family stress tolerance protein n=1 Tax=Actinobacillus pleuropneumoniae TaxID=715 RepID=UPI003B018CF3